MVARQPSVIFLEQRQVSNKKEQIMASFGQQRQQQQEERGDGETRAGVGARCMPPRIRRSSCMTAHV